MGLVPTGSMQKHDAVFVGKLRRGLGQKDTHQAGIDPRQNHRRHLPVGRADGHVGVDIFADQLTANGGSQRQRSPTASRIADAPKTSLVLKQYAHPSARRKALGYGVERSREFFLKASVSAG